MRLKTKLQNKSNQKINIRQRRIIQYKDTRRNQQEHIQ